MVDESGQIHTIEGFTAGFLLVLAMVYGVQSIAITPTSSSTASQEVELNNYKLADDILATASANGELREGILNWNASKESFVDSQQDENFYSGTQEGTFEFGAPVPGDLGETLNQTLTQRGIAYNIYLKCAGSDSKQIFAENGDESNHASTATTYVTLYDYDTVASNFSSDEPLANVSSSPDMGFYCEQTDDTSPIHSVVEVKISIWRM